MAVFVLIVFLSVALGAAMIGTAVVAKQLKNQQQVSPTNFKQCGSFYPPNQIYFTEATSTQVAADAKLSRVPMVILYYEPNNADCLQQEVNIQTAAQKWTTHIRYYRISVNTPSFQVPYLVFVQPDQHGNLIVLASSTRLLDVASSHDFLAQGMSLVD